MAFSFTEAGLHDPKVQDILWDRVIYELRSHRRNGMLIHGVDIETPVAPVDDPFAHMIRKEHTGEVNITVRLRPPEGVPDGA